MRDNAVLSTRQFEIKNRELSETVEVLGESEARLRCVVENLSEGVIIADLLGNLLQWNQPGLAMHGFLAEGESTRTWTAFEAQFELITLAGAPVPTGEWPLPRILRGEHLRDVEIKVKRRGGDWKKTISYSGRLASGGNGRQVAMLTAVDVTERNVAEEKLHEVHSQLQHVLSQSPAVLFTLVQNRDKILPRVRSENVHELLGFTVAETTAQGWYEERLHPADRQRVLLNRAAFVARGSGTMEYRLKRNDGTYRWVEDTSRSVRDASGAFSHGVGTWLDITERKRAEDVLKNPAEEKRRRYRTSALRDLAIVAVIGVATFVAATVFNLFETPLSIIEQHKETSLDELFGTILILSPLLAIFGYRRWRETQNALKDDLTPEKAAQASLSRETYRKILTDLLVITIFGLGLFLISNHFQSFEPVIDWIWRNRDGMIDEAFGTLIVLCPAFLAFAYRRWRETRTEIERHEQTATALRVLNIELDHRVQQRTAELAEANEGLKREVVERQRAERRLKLQQAVTMVLAETASQTIASKQMLQIIGRELDWDFGELWMVDRAAKVLRCSETWHTSPTFSGVATATHEATFARNEGLAGRVWSSGKTEWVRDIFRDGQSLRNLIIHKAELSSWVGAPILLRNEVVGVMGFFSAEAEAPDPDVMETLAALGGQFGQFVERLLLSEQFRQAQKLDAIGTLAAGVAHDFNNIIAGISGNTELVKMTMDANLEAQESLDAILQGTGRAASLVKQILAFSRQEDGDRKPVQLRHLVMEAMRLLRPTLDASIHLVPILDADPSLVLADAGQVHQILMNLFSNAVHAMKKSRRGQLGVKLEEVLVTEDLAERHAGLQTGHYVRLSVSDTGHGMDEAVLARIFEPFFTTKTPGKGTGLGLAVAHGIMQTHRGVIVVESQPDEGSTFHLYFPALAGAAPTAGLKASDLARGSGERILYVDDEEILVRTVGRLLRGVGYEVDTFTNPGEAFAHFAADPSAYKLVITDLAMPGMSGTDLAQQLLLLRKDIPIILITGYNSTLTLERVQEMGLRDLVMKPATIETLSAAIRGALKPNSLTR